MRKSTLTVLYCATALTAFEITMPQLAAAQVPGATPAETVPPETAEVEDAGTITVTARRREESIVDVPLAITVVTAATLDKLDIATTGELANYVPGLQFSDFTAGDSRNDRGRARPLIFRGINTGGGGTVTAAGGLFLDGAAVVGNEIPAGMDIGAVEILRGPQSVYFGRSTMTGAVSYRTKNIPNRWIFQGEATLAERDMNRFEVSIAGPIIADVLKLRITGLTEDTDGYVRNDANPRGDKLGARSRDSISATVDITPTNGVEFKVYANYFRDEDGPAATTFIPAQFSNCLQPTQPGFETLRTLPRRTICGKIPDRRNAINFLRTDIPTALSDAIFNTPLIRGAGFDRKVGLQREVFNSHINASLKMSDYLKLLSVTGYHTNVTLASQDGIGQPVQVSFPLNAYFYALANKVRDFSQEFRLMSDPERAFSWTAGVNYVNAYDKVQAAVAFQDQMPGTGVLTTFRQFPQNLGTSSAKTYGFFGGAYLKLFDDKLTVSAEGRYQIDKRRQRQQNGTTFVELNDLRETFKSFNPRVSLDYDLGGNRKVYASYASGTRPGGFNALLLTYFNAPVPDPVVIQQIQDLLGVSNETFDEEKLKIGEIGFKGSFGSGKGYFDLNAYYGVLSNQQVAQGALIPKLGFTVVATTNIGETEVYGVEAEGNYRFSDNLSLRTTFAWNHATRTQFLNQGGINQFGTNDLSGAKTANVPEFSGSAVASYEQELSANWDFFGTVAYVYRGKTWTDPANLSFIDGRHQVDLRAGVSDDRFTIEGFALNVLNDRSYTNGSVAPDFGQPESAAAGTNTALTSRQFQAFFGGIAPPRQLGVRVRVKI